MPKPTSKPADEEALTADAWAFREAHGAEWPDAALDHLRTLASGPTHADRDTFERWVRIMELMEEMEQPAH